MKYTSFYIKNYKGIRELTLDLERQPISNVITLVGLNESGKTSILEAISLLEIDIEENEVHELIPKAEKAAFNDTIEIHATVSLDDQDQDELNSFCRSLEIRENDQIDNFKIKSIYHFEDSKFVSEKFYLDFDFYGVKKNHSNRKKFNPGTDIYDKIHQFLYQNTPPIIYYPNFLFDFPYRIYLEVSEDESEEQATYRQVIRDIIDTFGDGLDIQKHIIDRIKSGSQDDKEALEATLERMSYQITEVVFDAWKELFEAKGKEIRLIHGLDEQKKLCFLEVRLKEITNTFKIAERSLGFKWFFTFLLFTEFRKNSSSVRL